MNDNDKWLILDTEPLKRLYSTIQEGDEVYIGGGVWRQPNRIRAVPESPLYRRLRSKAWLKASEHPMQFPAYVCAPSGNVFCLATADNAPCDGPPPQWLWQPAPQLPDPPAKEDACEKAWVKQRDADNGFSSNIAYNAFKAGWEARGEK